MNCPYCKEPDMEREDSWAIGKEGKLTVPAAYYSCSGCGASFYWVKGCKLQVLHKGTQLIDLEDLHETM